MYERIANSTKLVKYTLTLKYIYVSTFSMIFSDLKLIDHTNAGGSNGELSDTASHQNIPIPDLSVFKDVAESGMILRKAFIALKMRFFLNLCSPRKITS